MAIGGLPGPSVASVGNAMPPVHVRLIAGLFLAALLAAGAGCVGLVEGVVANMIIQEMSRVDQYHAEVQVLGQPNRRVRVYYSRFWHIHQQVISPAEIEGEVFIFDGERFLFYSPIARRALSITGIVEPSLEEWRVMVRQRVAHTREAMEFEKEGSDTIIGREVVVYRSSPRDASLPLPLVSRTWIDKKTKIPLKVINYRPDGTVLRGFEHTLSDFDSPLPPEAFDVSFVDGTSVTRWDLGRLDEKTRPTSELVRPGTLPLGLRFLGAIESPDTPGAWLSVYENRPWFLILGQWNDGQLLFPLSEECTVRVLQREFGLHYLTGLHLVGFTFEGQRLFLLSNVTLNDLLAIEWHRGPSSGKPTEGA